MLTRRAVALRRGRPRTRSSTCTASATTRRTSIRTHDYGKTWTRIVDGLATNQPSGSFARVVRNDPKKRGLLFAGTESGMYVSFDDGDHWQTLMQNLPTTSYRDIAIKDNDLVVATYGRGFWVIDDYSMLRQIAPAIASEPAHLFKPGDAVRIRRNVGADTPFPPEVPHALNPLDGAIIDYWLARASVGRDHTRRPRLGRRARAPSVERADRAGDRGRASAASELLGRAAIRATGERGDESHALGSALRCASRVLALVRDQRESRDSRQRRPKDRLRSPESTRSSSASMDATIPKL